MSWASANADIRTALTAAGVTAPATPDMRNRETDVPAIVWTMIESNPTESASGSGAPYHTRFDFDCLSTSRIAAETLADQVAAALAAATSFLHARETNRTTDVLVRGADKTPLYVATSSMSITFGA